MGNEQSPADVFRDNLHRLAGAHGLDFDTLASVLGVKGEDKKWLGRLWENGLNRPDERKRPDLEGLVKVLGLQFVGGMWIPDVEASPSMLGGDPNRWIKLTETIYKCLVTLKHLWNRYPREMYEIVKINDKFIYADSRLVTGWAAHRYGYTVGDDGAEIIEELEKLSECLQAEWGEAIQFEERGSLTERVFERMTHHFAWPEVLRLAGYEANRHIEGQRVIQRAMKQSLQNAINQPPSVEEVYRRFASRYLDPLLEANETVPDDDSSLSIIMERLHSHPEWPRYVELAFDGDQQVAQQGVKKKWDEARQKSGKTISVDSFVDFHLQILSDLKKPDRDDQSSR